MCAARRTFQGFAASPYLAYFHIPPVWIGEAPTLPELQQRQMTSFGDVCSRRLQAGVSVSALKDGFFVFDFTNWAPGAPVLVPSYTTEEGGVRPVRVTRAEEQAKAHLYKCISVMNAHLACLSSSLSTVQGLAIPLRQVVTPATYLRADNSQPRPWFVGLNPSWEPLHAYIEMQAGLLSPSNATVRQVFRQDAVLRSFDLLEHVLTYSETDLLTLVNLLYLGAVSYTEHDFPTALVLAWTVCERLIRILWDRYISENSEITHENGKKVQVVNSKGKDKLKGRDYTASVMTEVLSIARVIDYEMYKRVDQVRSVRNGWLHSLDAISDRQASIALQTSQDFLAAVSGISMKVTLSHSMHF